MDNKGNTIDKLFEYLSSYFREMGIKLVYSALLMFYAYQRKDTPRWAKNIIIGAIAYLFAPIDGIPDLAPFLGFTDDLGIMTFGLVTIACYINEEVRSNAKKRLSRYYDNVDGAILEEVDLVL